MSKKVNWAEIDKRIRNRKKDFSALEVKEIEEKLQKLPDLAEQVEIVTIIQPAVAPPEDEDGGDVEPEAGEPN
jgi:hypothetical protein